jgi:hypothetical protein
VSSFRPLCVFALLLAASDPAAARDPSQVHFRQQKEQLVVLIGDNPVAVYVYRDEAIPRPYFAHVKTLSGQQVTRNHPPAAGQDRDDHATMHPGIWMAFGDLSGNDFWRNKASIVHHSFTEISSGADGSGCFVQRKDYRGSDNTLLCSEVFKCSIHRLSDSYLLVWDSTFRSDREFYFGDQEEMGLGMRVATPISEVGGGRMRDAEGRSGAKNIWSHAAAWCDCSGEVKGQPCGIALMCHPENFRPSWMHARDYGLVAANPFGTQAMHKGPPSKVFVKPGEELRLRYALWIYDAGQQRSDDPGAAYRHFLQLTEPP